MDIMELVKLYTKNRWKRRGGIELEGKKYWISELKIEWGDVESIWASN